MDEMAFKMSNKSIHMNAKPIPFLSEFYLMRLAEFKFLYQSNSLFDTNECFLIPLAGIKNETKPMPFNAVM